MYMAVCSLNALFFLPFQLNIVYERMLGDLMNGFFKFSPTNFPR